MTFEHFDTLLHGHVNLVTDRHETFSEMFIIAHHEPDSDHEVINVVEDERVLATVGLLALKEMHGVIPPVTEGVEMMRRVITVIVAVPIAL